MKEITNEQRLEVVFFHINGISYHKLLNITGYLMSSAVEICKNFGKNKKCKKYPV